MNTLRRVSPKEAYELMNQESYVYIDVRSIPEFEAGHPTGASNIPLMHWNASGMSPNPDFIKIVEANYPKDSKIIVGCKSGGRSLRAAQMLIQQGYSCVVDQRAGFEGTTDPFGTLVEAGWRSTDLPSEGGDGGVKSYLTLSLKG